MRLAERSPAAAGTSGGTVPKGGREKEDARERIGREGTEEDL